MLTFGFLFKSLDCALRQSMDLALSDMDLTFAQGHIMGFLAQCAAPPCAKDIEDRFQLSHPTVSGLLARLEEPHHGQGAEQGGPLVFPDTPYQSFHHFWNSSVSG